MSNPLKPRRTPGPRSQTDNAKRHGAVMMAPRLPEIGGANSMHAKGGPFRNSLSIRKPGGKS